MITGTVTDTFALGGGPTGQASLPLLTGEDGLIYKCDYTDLTTEGGFRTLAVGEQVRFLPDGVSDSHRARYVVHLDEPTPAELLGLTEEPA